MSHLLQVYRTETEKLIALVRPRCKHRPELTVIAQLHYNMFDAKTGSTLYRVVSEIVAPKWEPTERASDTNSW